MTVERGPYALNIRFYENPHVTIIINFGDDKAPSMRTTFATDHPRFNEVLQLLYDSTDGYGKIDHEFLFHFAKFYKNRFLYSPSEKELQAIITHFRLNEPSVRLETFKWWVDQAAEELSKAKRKLANLEMDYSALCIDYDACEICHDKLGKSNTSICLACQNLE